MKKIIKKYLVTFIITLFLFSLNISYQINNNTWDNFFSEDNSLLLIFLVCIILSIPITYLIDKLINKIKTIDKKTKTLSKKTYFIFFILFIFVWTIQLLTFFPGGGMNDSIYIINSPIYTSHQHPLIYNLIIGYLFRFFKHFSNPTIAYGTLCFLQIILSSIILTYVCYYLEKNTNSKYPTIILFLFYLLIPIIGNSTITIVKDTPFSLFLILFIINCYNLVTQDNKKYIYIHFILFIIISVLRNNGIYIAFITSIVLLIINFNKKFIYGIIIALIISMIPSKLSSLLTNQEQLFQEKVAIPIQQIASVVKYDGVYNKENEEVINNYINTEDIKILYVPDNVDSIKWNDAFKRDYLQQHKFEFIKLWGNLLPNNFELYVKAWIIQTNGYWTINKFQPSQSRFLGLEDDEFKKAGIYEKNLLNKSFENFYTNTLTFLGCGTCFWVIIILGLFSYIEKDYKKLIMLVPILCLVFTLLISAPVSNLFRYTYIYLYFLPFWILFTLFKTNKI